MIKIAQFLIRNSAELISLMELFRSHFAILKGVNLVKFVSYGNLPCMIRDTICDTTRDLQNGTTNLGNPAPAYKNAKQPMLLKHRLFW